MTTAVYWKKVWLTVNGDARTVTVSEARDVLDLVKSELLEGLVQFQPYKEHSLNLIPALSEKLKEKGGDLEQLLEKLNLHINLRSDIGWNIFCNFLTFDYYGKVEDIQKLAEHQLYNTILYKQLWVFYSAERMYMLKTMKLILENGKNKNHKFHNLYKDFLKSLDYASLRKSLLEQFSFLKSEIRVDNENHCIDCKEWASRNCSEQLEVMHMLILITDYELFTVQDFVKLLDICRRHNFGMYPMSRVHKSLDVIELSKIKFTELAVLIVSAKKFWVDWDSWNDVIVEVGHRIFTSFYEDENSILLLLCVSIQIFTSDKETLEELASKFKNFLRIALEQKPFSHLYRLIQMSEFQDCRTGILLKEAVFNFLEYLSYNFLDNSQILAFEGVVDIIAELAKEPRLAIAMVNSNEAYKIFYKTIFTLFPYSFESFVKITTSLLQHKEISENIFESMKKFKTFTEIYNDTPFESELELKQSYSPKLISSITIPAGTRAKITKFADNSFICLKFTYSFFDILDDLSKTIISETGYMSENKMKIVSNVSAAYKCLIPMLRNPKAFEYLESINCIQPMHAMTARSAARPFISLELFSTCLEIETVLSERDPEKITNALIAHNILPQLMKDWTNMDNLFNSNSLSISSLVLAIRDEVHSGQLNILFSYIKLLRKLGEMKKCISTVLLPGWVFIFLNIFCIHLSWPHGAPRDIERLSEECLSLLVAILRAETKDMRKDFKVIFDFCFELAADHVPTIETLIKLFRMTNPYVNCCMMKESNWEKRTSTVQIQCLKNVLTIINIVLTLDSKGEQSLTKKSFLKLFVDSYMKPSNLKLLTGYMHNSFDSSIPKLSCQILKKLAVNPDVLMLSLLEMDKYQLQCLFLEKLRDPLEDEILKVAILDLITLCVQHQSGMIVAFFDISYMPETTQSIGDSVSSFMEEYLENIRKSTDYLYSPIQAAVLDLFHALWMYNKNMLVSDLAENEKFWSTLTEPLFTDLKLPKKTYTQIIKILTYELFRSKGSNPRVNEVIDKLFSVEQDTMVAWRTYILKVLKDNQDIVMLRCWKNLFMATGKNYPNALKHPQRRESLLELCLSGIGQHFSDPQDIRILTSWVETYLYFITQWPDADYGDKVTVQVTFSKIFCYLGEFYTEVSQHLKQMVMSIAIRTIKDVQEDRVGNSLVVEKYLSSIGVALEKEFFLVMGRRQEPEETRGTTTAVYSNWILLITFGMELLESRCSVCQEWFKNIQFLGKLVKSIKIFMNNSVYFPIAKRTVRCIIAYAQSPLVHHFLYEDLEAFFDATQTTDKCVVTLDINYKNVFPWRYEDWWVTYTGVIQVLRILLNKYRRLILDKVMNFVLVHLDVIRNVLQLPLVTVEPTALRLVSECLSFIHTLLQFRFHWRLHYPEIYFQYLQAINTTVNAVTNIILRPTILKVFVLEEGNRMSLLDTIPTNFLITIMNSLVDIISWSCLCFLRVCPSILTLMNKYEVLDDIIVEYVFHIPKLFDDTVHQLKYGTLLCLLHFLTKTLQLQRTPSATNLNTSDIPTDVNYLAFVCPDFYGTCLIADKYVSLQTFPGSEGSTPPTKWITRLDQERVGLALESLASFLAIQIYLSLYIRPLSLPEVAFVRRELCSELMYFHEYSRKGVMDLGQYKVMDNMVYRKFYAEKFPYLILPNQDFYAKLQLISENDVTLNLKSIRVGDSMEDYKKIFYHKDDFTSIHAIETDVQEEESKAIKTRPLFLGISDEENILMDEVTLRYPKDDFQHRDDFLLMLSHWFFNICHLKN